jgi:hypothetical protein
MSMIVLRDDADLAAEVEIIFGAVVVVVAGACVVAIVIEIARSMIRSHTHRAIRKEVIWETRSVCHGLRSLVYKEILAFQLGVGDVVRRWGGFDGRSRLHLPLPRLAYR